MKTLIFLVIAVSILFVYYMIKDLLFKKQDRPIIESMKDFDSKREKWNS